MDAAALVVTYGYPAVVLGAVLEGETVVLAAGYLAHRHHLALGPVAACAALGATFGDQAFFLVGRRAGERALARLPSSLAGRIAWARAEIARRPVRVLLSMRFLYGMRIALPILCGSSGIGLARFARYNVGTAVVWATLFTGLGYAFGAAASAALAKAEHYEWWLLVALVVLAVVLHRVAAWRLSRRR